MSALTITRPEKAREKPAELYELSDQFYQTALRAAVRESLSLPVSLNEAQDVRVKPNFETACWSFQPPHRIFVGNKLFNKPNIRKGLSIEQQDRYVRNHYHHEQAHGLYTERSMPRIQKALTAIRAPFQVYNLFEDGYIEDRYRREAEYRFSWLSFEELFFQDRAESLLFALIQAEGDRDLVAAELDLWTPPLAPGELPCFPTTEVAEPPRRVALRAMFERVCWYYGKIVAVKSSMMLMPLLNLWLDEFGRPPENKGGGGGLQDMQLSIELGTNAQAMADFDADTLPLVQSNRPREPQTADRNHKAERQSADLLEAKSTGSLDKHRVTRVANQLARLFKRHPLKTRSSVPSAKISARHYSLGLPAFIRKEDVTKKVRTIYLEVDCSGSMRGEHMREGRILIAALSELAAKGAVKGHVVLSGILPGGVAGWQAFALPLADEVIERIEGKFGAEGLEYTLQANQALAKAADFAFVYTDANICDKPVDKSAWHAKGLFTWGLYVGTNSPEIVESMLEYFDKAVVRSSAEELVAAVLLQASKS